MSFHFIGTSILAIFILFTFVFWLWMLRDCLYNKSLTGFQKFAWFLLIFFTQMIGAIVYFIIERSKK